jgi:hypothetical protein
VFPAMLITLLFVFLPIVSIWLGADSRDMRTRHW